MVITAMRLLLLLFFGVASLGFASDGVLADDEADALAARGGYREVPIWPEGIAILQQGIRALAHEKNAITHPSLLIYSPVESSSRAAVLVFPGGGYKAVAVGPQSTIGLDGADVCQWLTNAGITCVLVKYRVPNTGCNQDWTPTILPDNDPRRARSLNRGKEVEYFDRS
jgi:hypothetical protein